MGRTRCAACDDLFTPRHNVSDQKYCSKTECQRERCRRWQRQKLREDPDYRANQAAAQRRWRERHPEYWRRYRQSHPTYTERNRDQQRQRNARRKPVATSPSPPAIAPAQRDLHQPICYRGAEGRARRGMIVVDASVILDILLRSTDAGLLEDRVLDPYEVVNAPHLLDV